MQKHRDKVFSRNPHMIQGNVLLGTVGATELPNPKPKLGPKTPPPPQSLLVSGDIPIGLLCRMAKVKMTVNLQHGAMVPQFYKIMGIHFIPIIASCVCG